MTPPAHTPTHPHVHIPAVRIPTERTPAIHISTEERP